MSTVWITGASGLLGSYLVRTSPKGIRVVGDRVDILSRPDIRAYLEKYKPTMIIHCAGDGRADYVEQNPKWGTKINVEGTQNLLVEAEQHKSHFVYISSNAVYDGEKPLYSETSEQKPINQYGKSKAEAESVALCYPKKLSIIRPIFLYGWIWPGRRQHAANRILQNLEAGKEVEVADDILTQPTYALDCASTIWKLAQKQEDELAMFNIAPAERISLYDFALRIAKAFGHPRELIKPVSASKFTSLAKRPKDTSFDVAKLTRAGIVLEDSMHGLIRMREDRDAKDLGMLLY